MTRTSKNPRRVGSKSSTGVEDGRQDFASIYRRCFHGEQVVFFFNSCRRGKPDGFGQIRCLFDVKFQQPCFTYLPTITPALSPILYHSSSLNNVLTPALLPPFPSPITEALPPPLLHHRPPSFNPSLSLPYPCSITAVVPSGRRWAPAPAFPRC